MADLQSIMSIPKSDIHEAAKALKSEDIPNLVELLSSKNDNIRYQAFCPAGYNTQNSIYARY